MRRLLSGNEATARGIWQAGAAVGSAYPGTPSTEIMETFAKFPGVYAEWAPNEKVALDVAIGAAYAGARSFAAMKHVGLNVAADSLFYVAMTGIEAGLLIISADDPSMHSSQNEQDNRQYARFARIPCLEPSDSQEAKDFAMIGFDLSEQFDTPVLYRLTTRICHTSSLVTLDEERLVLDGERKFPRNVPKYVMIPAYARKRYQTVEHRLKDLSDFAEKFQINKIEERSSKLGIITAGISYQYAREVFPDASILKLGMTYPLPQTKIREFSKSVDRVVVLEELDPFLEDQIRLMGVDLYRGIDTNQFGAAVSYPKTKSIFPLSGELNPSVVKTAGIENNLLEGVKGLEEGVEKDSAFPNRPSALCPGCPHRSTFYVLHKLKVPVNGDIGCYTLGVAPPLSSIHTIGCMGASIGVAHGAAVAGDSERHVAVIGDSTFFHTGIPALINIAYNKSNVITIIMDNRVTGMTGHQENPGTGRTLQNVETSQINLEDLVRAIGINKVTTVEAYDVGKIEETLKEWLKESEPAVLITKEECALLPSARKKWRSLEVQPDKCNGCTLCFRIGCPAIQKSEQMDEKYNRPLAEIDPMLCTGCEICAQVCPRDAILFRDQILDGEGNS